MSDSPPDQANQRRRRRGGRNRSQGSGGSGHRPMGTTPRPPRTQPQSGFEKFLSAISFGLLGKPKSKPRPSPAPRSAAPAKPAARTESPRPPREPKPRREYTPVSSADINTERLYVGNLSYDASESDLFELFNGVGSVRNAEVVVNNRTQRSKGFAFVTMASVEEARRAVDTLNGKEFMGRGLQISGAKPIGSGQDRDGSESDEA